MRRAYSYIRFSSAAQAAGSSLDRQMELTTLYCQRKGYELDDTLSLRDLGVSAFRGDNVREGALAGFLEACRHGRVSRGSVLVVESLDRLSRDQVRPALQLLFSILDAGVSIVTLQPEREYTPEQCDALSLIEPLIIFSRGHEESTLKSSRIKDSWGRRRARKTPMTGRCPEWLRMRPDRRSFEEIPGRADAIRSIFRLCREGLGVRRIVQELNKLHAPFGRSKAWTMAYVMKILTWRAVLGEHQPHEMEGRRRKPSGDVIPDYYPAVITPEQFYQAQQAMGARKGRVGRTPQNNRNLFTGMVRHAADGSRMVLKRSDMDSDRHVYLTSNAYLHGHDRPEIHSVPYLPFEQAVVGYIRQFDVGPLDGARDGRLAEISRISGEQLVLEERIAQTLAMQESTKDFDVFLRLLQQLEAKKKENAARLEELLRATAARNADVLGQTRALLDLLGSGGEAQALRARVRAKLRVLIDELWVYPERSGKYLICTVQVVDTSGSFCHLYFVHPDVPADQEAPRPSVPAGVDLRTWRG